MIIDPTDWTRAAQIERRLAAIVENSDDAIISKDFDGIITTWNPGAERLFGYTAEEVIGKPITILIPPERQDEEPGILERIRQGERIHHYETVRLRKDGGLVDISLTVSPVRDADGKIIGASKIARDITEPKRAREQQRLLFREMNHRINNLLALVGGIVALSARSAKTPKDLAAQVRTRLEALARAHQLMLPNLNDGLVKGERTTTLLSLIRTIVSPYCDVDQGPETRVIAAGPELAIGENSVTSLALLLHEFATNAVKHGALSSPRGRVNVDWFVEDDLLNLTWRELDGPLLSGQPQTEGFGTLLTQATVTGQLAGRISRDWYADGLIIEVSVPLQRLTT
ncbi:histidine kinase [Beijerinckiaceae bacterium]|nr:histidine kinase [Beijerinckiaceae bacterium]